MGLNGGEVPLDEQIQPRPVSAEDATEGVDYSSRPYRLSAALPSESCIVRELPHRTRAAGLPTGPFSCAHPGRAGRARRAGGATAAANTRSPRPVCRCTARGRNRQLQSVRGELGVPQFSVGLWGSSPPQHRHTSSLIRDTTLPEPAAVAWARRMSSAASTTGTSTTASLAAAARAAVSSDALLLPPRDCHLAVPVC